MAINPRGGIDIDQMKLDFLSGDVNAEKFATTDAAPKQDGNLAIWLNGNVVDGGSGATLSLLFDDAANLILNDTAHVITP
jgi:hypothetical protein